MVDSNSSTEIYLKNIVSHMPGSIYWKDKNGVFLGCNQFVADMAGLKHPDDLIGKSDYELIWKGMADEIRKNDLEIMRTKQKKEFEEFVTLKDGRRITMLTNKAPLLDGKGKVIGIIGVSIDITERKKLGKALVVANNAKIRFMRTLNQLFRTPLNNIVGLAQLLLTNKFEKKIIEYIEIIEKSGRDIIPILDRIIYYLQLEKGELIVQPEHLNLKRNVQKIIENIMPTAKEKDIKLKLNYGHDAPSQVIGVPLLTGEILGTLIKNAVRFTQQGEVNVNVTLLAHEDDYFLIEFAVKDTGIGIHPQTQKHLFDLFDLDVDLPDEAFEQPGLNLSIAKKIAEKLGGTITVNSSPGKGSFFKVRIKYNTLGSEKPYPEVEHDIKKYEVEPQEIKSKQRKKSLKKPINILLVEDNLLNLKVVQFLFVSLYNCHFTTAMSYSQALDLISKDYDLILTDINLPDGKGTNLVKKIKDLKKSKTPPIIAITAHASPEEDQILVESGNIQEIITKPIQLSDVREIIENYVINPV